MISTILRNARLRARLILGLVLLLHGLAHLSAVINATNRIIAAHDLNTAEQAHSQLWAVSLLSALAVSALLAGGLGALRVRVLAARWRALALSGLSTSIILLALYPAVGNLPGLLISLSLFALLYRRPRLTGAQAGPARKLTWFGRATSLTWLLLISFTAVALAFRPVWLRWGTQPGEVYFELPGDQQPPGMGFQILHAVNINATPDQIWPWLAQIGHDRAGFYSYAWLENLFGLQIVNAERVVPAWQSRQVGELVPSTPPDWLGVVDQPLGWRVRCFERDSVLALDQWGAFALVRIDPANTRFYIRTLGKPGIRASFIWSPLELLLFEPVHFIMQRRMMLGIKERAEAQAREPCTAT